MVDEKWLSRNGTVWLGVVRCESYISWRVGSRLTSVRNTSTIGFHNSHWSGGDAVAME